MYQLFRSLAYIHSMGICHRDIKPQNLLLDPESAVLKLCDFGSAKQLVKGELNVSYICSRYYRAPELIFGATDYTCNIDIWSAGCVLAELLLGQPIFPGDSGVDQLVEIIKVLGTPTRDQIRQMNPNYQEFKFPQIRAHPWNKVFRPRTPPEAIHLASKLLEYTPTARITPLEACAHAFFDELREPNNKLPNGRDLPPLFNLTPHELGIQPALNSRLIPAHYQAAGSTSSGETKISPDSAAPASNTAAATLANVATASAAVSASTTSTSQAAPAQSASSTTPTANGNGNAMKNGEAAAAAVAAATPNGTQNGASLLSHANINSAVDSLSLNASSNTNNNNASSSNNNNNNNNNAASIENQAAI